MYRFLLVVIVVGLAAPSDAFARDRRGRGRVVVGGHRPAVRSVYTSRHYSAPRYHYSRPSYSYHRSYRQPSYRPSYYRSYAPAPRYYYPPPRRIVSRSRSVSVGSGYYRSTPSYYVVAPPVVVVPAPAPPIVYAAPSYAAGDYYVGQYIGGRGCKFKFVGSAGRVYEAEVDDGIIEEIELD